MFSEKKLSICRSAAERIADFAECSSLAECENLYDCITDYLTDQMENGNIGGATYDLWCYRAVTAFSYRVSVLERDRGWSK